MSMAGLVNSSDEPLAALRGGLARAFELQKMEAGYSTHSRKASLKLRVLGITSVPCKKNSLQYIAVISNMYVHIKQSTLPISANLGILGRKIVCRPNLERVGLPPIHYAGQSIL